MIYIIHHDDTDGFGSAFAAWKKFGDNAKYYPINHGQPFPIKEELQKEDDVYILDFSFPDIMPEISEKCNLIVIDHHKTAIDKYSKYTWFHHDITKSGCVLSWEYFNQEQEVPLILLYVQDWDLWKFELPNTQIIHPTIEIYKGIFSWWAYISFGSKETWDQLLNESKIIAKHQSHIINLFVNSSWKINFEGYVAAVVNAPYPFISDTCDALLRTFPEADLAISIVVGCGYHSWSLRSRMSSDIDVGALALKHGGGGHKHASGFKID